jgi:hypothetical protein
MASIASLEGPVISDDRKLRAGAFGDFRMRSGLCFATMLASFTPAAAETPLTVDQLLAQGWEIAG